MKKCLCLFLALICLVGIFSSCGSGRSISIYALIRDNEIKNLFGRYEEMESYVETVCYEPFEERQAYSYEIYYERATDIYAGYNICETIGSYTLYAYEGSIFTETENGLCAVIPLSGTYFQYIDGYLTGKSPFLAERLNQIEAKSSGKLKTARYYSSITPQQAANIRDYGASTQDQIISEFRIEDETFLRSVSFSIKRASDGEICPIVTHQFSGSKEKEDRFQSIKDLTANISLEILYVGEEKAGKYCKVPAGIPIGFDCGEKQYEFFYDEACTKAYSYLDGAPEGNLTIYAKAK